MHSGMQHLDLFRSFGSVVDTGRFTRAGERVHRAQSTVRQQIGHLEEFSHAIYLSRTGVTPVGN